MTSKTSSILQALRELRAVADRLTEAPTRLDGEARRRQAQEAWPSRHPWQAGALEQTCRNGALEIRSLVEHLQRLLAAAPDPAASAEAPSSQEAHARDAQAMLHVRVWWSRPVSADLPGARAVVDQVQVDSTIDRPPDPPFAQAELEWAALAARNLAAGRLRTRGQRLDPHVEVTSSLVDRGEGEGGDAGPRTRRRRAD